MQRIIGFQGGSLLFAEKYRFSGGHPPASPWRPAASHETLSPHQHHAQPHQVLNPVYFNLTVALIPTLLSDIVKGVNNCSVEDRSGRPFVVSIEGNIGSGKSTMLKYFEKFQDVELVPEPVAEWCDVGGHNLLGKLYEDPKRWSFQFQSYVQLTRLQLLKKQTDCSVKIIERSIQNNRFCFLENARREGSLSGSELEVFITTCRDNF